MKDEGWFRLLNANKRHYFRAGRSLCRKWLVLGNPSFHPLANDSLDCVVCSRLRKKETSND